MSPAPSLPTPRGNPRLTDGEMKPAGAKDSGSPHLDPGLPPPRPQTRAGNGSCVYKHVGATGRSRSSPETIPSTWLCSDWSSRPEVPNTFLSGSAETAWADPGRKDNGRSMPAEPEQPDWPEQLAGGRALPAENLGEANGTGDGRKRNTQDRVCGESLHFSVSSAQGTAFCLSD